MHTKPTALVTGASTGIGLELARVLAREGFNLVLVARNRDRLAEVARELEAKYATRAKVMAKDVSLPQAPDEIHRECEAAGIVVDTLVNNAGYGVYGSFLETQTDDELGMLQLNVVALTHLTKLFAKDMARRGEGRILNVASTAAFQPGPGMAVYFASKAYVLSFSEGIAHELEPKGVTVTALCPGATRSEFFQRAGENIANSRLVKRGMMEAEDVAEAGYRALMSKKRIVVPGFANNLLARTVGFFPRKVITSISARIMERG